MNCLLWILLGVGLCKLGIYLTKGSEACESIFMFSVLLVGALLVSAGIFIITMASLVRMGYTNLENVLPFCYGLGIAFIFIGLIGLIGSIMYAVKCYLREG